MIYGLIEELVCLLKFSFPELVSIPQSVDSVSRIAWCRSIQKLVAPSRRSNSREKGYWGFSPENGWMTVATIDR